MTDLEQVRTLAHGALDSLERNRQRIDDLNVYPVPDGDTGTNLTLTGIGLAERLSVNDVTPGLLELLGVAPMRGRGFVAADAGRPVVIISHAFWQTRLAGDPGAVGREIVLGSLPHTVIGVLPVDFRFDLNASDVWRPIQLRPGQSADNYRVAVVARLRRGVSPSAIAAAI